MLEVAKAGSGPQFLLKFFPGDDLPWFLQQRNLDLYGLAGKLQARAVFSQFAGIRREFERAKFNGNRDFTRFRHTLPKQIQSLHPLAAPILRKITTASRLLTILKSSAYKLTWCYLFPIAFAWR